MQQMTRESMLPMTKQELRAWLLEHGLPVSGTKSEQIARILKHQNSQ